MDNSSSITADKLHQSLSEVEIQFAILHGLNILIKRNTLKMLRDPGIIIGTIVFPLIFYGLFSLIMSRVMAFHGFEYSQMLPVAIIIQAMLFTAMASASSIAEDHDNGFFQRIETMPISRSLPNIARAIVDLARASIAVLVISVLGIINGMKFNGGIFEMLLFFIMPLCFVFVTSLGMGMVGHWLRNKESASAIVSMIYLPLLMVSTAFTPTNLFPALLQPIVEFSPVTLVIEVMRGALEGTLELQFLFTVFAILFLLGITFLKLTTYIMNNANS